MRCDGWPVSSFCVLMIVHEYTCSCIYNYLLYMCSCFFQEFVDVSWKFMERVDCRCNVFQYCLKFGSRQDPWGRHLSSFVQVQAITWGTTDEAAHAVASLENILWLGKQFADYFPLPKGCPSQRNLSVRFKQVRIVSSLLQMTSEELEDVSSWGLLKASARASWLLELCSRWCRFSRMDRWTHDAR